MSDDVDPNPHELLCLHMDRNIGGLLSDERQAELDLDLVNTVIDLAVINRGEAEVSVHRDRNIGEIGSEERQDEIDLGLVNIVINLAVFNNAESEVMIVTLQILINEPRLSVVGRRPPHPHLGDLLLDRYEHVLNEVHVDQPRAAGHGWGGGQVVHDGRGNLLVTNLEYFPIKKKGFFLTLRQLRFDFYNITNLNLIFDLLLHHSSANI